MARKKKDEVSIEEQIVTFFTHGEPAAKQTLFKVITGILKNQAPAVEAPAAAPITRTRRSKVLGVGTPEPIATETAVNTDLVEAA